MEHKSHEIFNATIGTAAMSALYEIGLIEAVAESKFIDLAQFCQDGDYHFMSVEALVDTLVHYSVLTHQDGKVSTGISFDDFYANKGYFLWLVRGYGYMLRNLAGITHNDQRQGDYLQRDGKFIAMAGKDYGAQFVDAYFDEVMGQMPYTVAADIGCGSAERLINLAKADPNFKGVGIELNAGAVELATNNIKAQGLTDQVRIVHSDVTYLAPHTNLEDIDLLFSFFMAHDLWPREDCLKALVNIREVFPNTKRFLLCDTYRSGLPAEAEKPIFTFGFEVTHAVMGQYIPTKEDWLDLFVEAGWECASVTDIGIPYSAIFDLRPTK